MWTFAIVFFATVYGFQNTSEEISLSVLVALDYFKHTRNKQYYYPEHELSLCQTPENTRVRGKCRKIKVIMYKSAIFNGIW